ARAIVAAGGTDPGSRRGRQDEPRDRRRAAPRGEDREELRVEHPVEAGGRSAGRGRRVPGAAHDDTRRRRVALLRELAPGLPGRVLDRALRLLGGALGLERPVLRDAADLLLHAADRLVRLALRLRLLTCHSSTT